MAAVCLTVALPCLAESDASAAEPQTEPDATAAAAAVPVALEEIPTELERARAALRDADAATTPADEVETLRAALPALAARVQERSDDTRDQLKGRPSVESLDDLETEWLEFDRTVQAANAQLVHRAQTLGEQRAGVRVLAAHWQQVAEEARGEGAPEATLQRIESLRSAIGKTQQRIEAARADALTLQSTVGDVGARVSSTLASIRETRRERVGRLLARDHSALWSRRVREQEVRELPARLRAAVSEDATASLQYLRGRHQQIGLEVLGLVALAWLLARTRQRIARWDREDPKTGAVARVLERPISAAIVLAVLGLPWLHPSPPPVLAALVQSLALVPALRILLPMFGPGLRPALLVLAGFYLVDQLRHASVGVPLLPRSLFVLEMGAGALFMFVLLRPKRLAALPPAAGREGRFRWTGRGLRLLRAAFGFAFFAAVAGYLELAAIVGSGALRSAYLAAVLYAALRILRGLLAFLLRTPALARLRVVRRHRELIERRARRALLVSTVAAWTIASLDSLSLRDGVLAAGQAVLGAHVRAGSLTFSLGGVLLFFAIVWLSFLTSRFLRFLLDEEVYDRLSLPRGAPYAISMLAHYGILVAGFLLAVFSMGVDLDRFALVAGAFGVGIGFGLQNVVNNFVSGLILLFERPVQVGDTVQIGDLLGDVRRIGIRSSTVRTWAGAEVIVPNASLISDQVTNWTLSDRLRRIDVPVGVAYGNDPERVIELLTEVARSHPQVLSEPAPEVLFLGFGESSLDFQIRAWTASFARWLTIRSEITLATSRALREAGIEIPFPQRDLHLRSVAPDVERALKGD